jgi:hypothetical protein
MPIRTVEDLRAHISLAIEVELSTIPPYLYALYSIEDQASEAALLFRSIVTEEMLHLALATNLLLAVGGEPAFGGALSTPRYPSPLAHHRPELTLNLAPCSDELIRNMFMVIERPERRDAPPEADAFHTLGQFYHALEIAIERLAKSGSLFENPQRSRQLADPSFYAAVADDADDSGGLMLIDDVASADAAIEIIVHQGEGLSDERWADPSHQELTHYYKLESIACGETPLGTIRPAATNPRTSDFPDDFRPVSGLFNALYCFALHTLGDLFEEREDKARLVDRLYSIMLNGMGPTARYLMTLPLPGGLVAGPTFEIHEFRQQHSAEIQALIISVKAQHPQLGLPLESLNLA